MTAQAETFFLPAYLIRCVEQRFLALFSEGKLSGTTHTCFGQELSAVCLARHLGPDDVVFSNHRCHGHYIAMTDDVEGLVAEVMGKSTGVCGGKGGSQHLCKGNFYSNGIQGGIVPVSVGIALAQKLGQEAAITTVCIGDGTLGEGVVYESLNIAARWQVPLLILLENNLYAQSTAQAETFAGSITGRAEAFGIPAYKASTWDYQELDRAMAQAVAAVRDSGGPVFLQVDTYRLAAHSKSDDDRAEAELAHYWSRDALAGFLAEESTGGTWAPKLDALKQRVETAVRQADAAAFAPLPEPPGTASGDATLSPANAEGRSQIAAINDALGTQLAQDPRCLLLGEDIRSPYGGAFKATRGLSLDHSDRVLNAPISEAAIVGVANGLALRGWRPVAEIMFGDFLTLCFDQLLNHAAKFQDMYNGQVNLPLLVRAPMGGGRGYGPTHSQNLEKHLCGIPGLQVVALHGRARVGACYAQLAERDSPTLMIENKLLYPVRDDAPLPEWLHRLESEQPLPTTVLQPDDPPDLTIVAFGRMSLLAEEAAAALYDEDEIVSEIVLPLRLSPLDIGPILASVRRSKRLVIVEEGTAGFDLGGEVAAALAAAWRAPEAFRLSRVAAQPCAVPSARPLEDHMLPSKARLLETCLELFNA